MIASSGSLVRRLDDLLLSAYGRLAREREIAPADWPAHLRTALPEPPFYDVFARRRWRAAFAVASKIPVKLRTDLALVLPVWALDNDDEVPRNEWSRGALFVFADGDFLDVPAGFPEDSLMIAQVARAERPRIIEAGYLPRDYPTQYRDDDLAVTLGDHPERVISVEAEHAVAPVEKPTRSVPGFSSAMVAAIDLDAAVPVLAALGARDPRATYREHGAERWRELIARALADNCYENEDEDESEDEPA